MSKLLNATLDVLGSMILRDISSGDLALQDSIDFLIPPRQLFTVGEIEYIGNYINQEETPLSPTARF